MPYIGAGLTRFNTADELTVTGDAEFNANANFGDNDKVQLGASQDLQIYHNGNHSVIADVGTGNLQLRAANFRVTNSDNTETIITADVDDAVTLYYDNVAKLATKANGVDITGELQADSLDIDGNGTIDGQLTITTADNATQLTLKSTDDDATEGPRLDLRRDSASPANNDSTGTIRFTADDDGGTNIVFSEIQSSIIDVTAGASSGELQLLVRRGGNLREGMMMNDASVTFNEAGDDVDFRIESDTRTHAFFVQGSDGKIGINNSAPDDGLHVNENLRIETSSPVVRFKETDGSANENFQMRVVSGDLVFQTNNDAFNSASSMLELQKGGDVNIIDGNLKVASGHGIDFSATANSAGTNESELLDDFEKGTWTPTAATNSGSAASFGSAVGRYQKIGKMVTVYGFVTNINTTGTTSNAQLQVSGLPFTSDTSDCHGVAMPDNVTYQGARTQLITRADASADVLVFFQCGSGLAETSTDHGDLNSGVSDIFFQVTYQTIQ